MTVGWLSLKHPKKSFYNPLFDIAGLTASVYALCSYSGASPKLNEKGSPP